MARIVSDKVRDDSTYSTFENSSVVNRSAITGSGNSDLEKTAWYKCATCSTWCCCRSSSQESVSDDIDAHFSLAKQAQVWLTSLQLTASLLYLKPARSIRIQRRIPRGWLISLPFSSENPMGKIERQRKFKKTRLFIIHFILLSNYNNT